MNKSKGDVSMNDIVSGRLAKSKLLLENSRLKIALANLSARQRTYVLDPHSVGNTIRFGVISDTHWGSKYERIDAFVEFVRACIKMGIKDIYGTGDMFDGHGMYKGQEFEVYAHGADAQKEVFKKKIPQFKGVNFSFITGNHDGSFFKSVGLSMGNYISEVYDNWHFLGADSASIRLRTKSGRSLRISLIHPGGGTAYAVTYHLQKHIESLPGGQKPDAVFMGHYHKSVWMPIYRNVDGFYSGCFQSQTPFMASRNIAAMVGGWTIEATVTERKSLTRSIKAEFHSFFEPRDSRGKMQKM